MKRFWRPIFLLFLLVLLASTLVVWIWSYRRWETVYTETVFADTRSESHYTSDLLILEVNSGSASFFLSRATTVPKGSWKLEHLARPAYKDKEADPKAKFALHQFGWRRAVHDGGFAGAESDHEYEIAWPMWFAALLILMPSMFLVRSMIRLKREHQYRNIACANCGYDLRATPHRCPECGTIRHSQPIGRAPR